MGSDLLGAPLGGDVLGVGELCAPLMAGKSDEVLGDHRHRPPRALFPWRVGGGVDHNLTDDPPTGVMRVAPCDKEPRQRIGDSLGFGLGRVDVQMPQCCADLSALFYRPGQLPGGPPRSMSFIVDTSTVLCPAKLGHVETPATGDLVRLAGGGPALDGIVFDTPSRSKVVVAVVDLARGPVFRTVHPETLTGREQEGSDDQALRLLIRRTPPPVHTAARGGVTGRKGSVGFTRGAAHRPTGR
jgi:hypothetical protein